MNTQHSNKTTNRQGIPNMPAANTGNGNVASLHDNRPQSVLQKKLVTGMNNKNTTPGTIQKKANNTGLPDQLKSGVENLSGISMDDVKVHYNSSQPKQLQAHAYAQGTDIHVAPGQEKHLPHEAWHVVQQKQGRVRPTMQMKTGLPVNNDRGLEKEADNMGQSALVQRLAANTGHVHEVLNSGPGVAQCLTWGTLFKLTPALFVIGEAVLSFTSAGYTIATNPVNWWLAAPALMVGGGKFLRGILMMLQVAFFTGESAKKWNKRIIDTIRLFEDGASNVAIYTNIPNQKNIRKLAAFIANIMFAFIKLVRSFGHYLETEHSYSLSKGLQVLEIIEGVLVTISGAVNEEPHAIGLGVATGVSKITRGAAAHKLVSNREQQHNQQQMGGQQGIQVHVPIPQVQTETSSLLSGGSTNSNDLGV